jgi:GNAT superfamily N-acetyltransferase
VNSPAGASAPKGQFDRYPVELARDVETRDGMVVHLRPIQPEDDQRLMEFHDRLSVRSVYRRVFFVHPKLSATETEHFTHVDYVNRLALVVERDGQLIAVGRYDRTPGTTDAEVAFVVADEFQHHGLGTILLEDLAEAAWKNGITAFVAQTLAENRDMLDVFVKSGFQVTSSRDYGTVSLRFSIEPDDAYRSAYVARRDSPHPGQRAGTR